MVYWIFCQSTSRQVFTQNLETTSQPLIYYNLLCKRAHMNRMVMKQQLVSRVCHYSQTIEGPWPHKIQFQVSMSWPWMSCKGPHIYIVTALGHSVMWSWHQALWLKFLLLTLHYQCPTPQKRKIVYILIMLDSFLMIWQVLRSKRGWK